MKLSKELLSALRAVCKQRRDAYRSRCFNRHEADRQAVVKMLAGNATARRAVARAARLQRNAREMERRARWMLEQYGLDNSGENIGYTPQAHKRFRKAGGVIAQSPQSPERAETVIARLAQAGEAQGRAIIRELGIDWT